MDIIKKYWFLLVPLAGFAVWLITISTKIFDSAEQKVEVTNFVKNSPSSKDQWRKYLRDSVNTQHAIQTRQKRYEDGVKKDSIRANKDSLFLDMVKRQTVQIEQIKEQLKKTN